MKIPGLPGIRKLHYWPILEICQRCIERRAEAEDYIGLWELVDDIKLLDPDQQPEVVKARTLELVSEMLAGGFIAVDLGANGGYEAWSDQNPEAVVTADRLSLAAARTRAKHR